MKYLLASLFLFSSAVLGQTVINYDDGSTYTLEEKENILYQNSQCFLKKRTTQGPCSLLP